METLELKKIEPKGVKIAKDINNSDYRWKCTRCGITRSTTGSNHPDNYGCSKPGGNHQWVRA